jgi:glycosyltransferase involved in cell wall biosynthesis
MEPKATVVNAVTPLPKVSIVTPSYNQAAFLEQAMRSVLEQNYPNLEYIVVDGASKDGSVDIIRRYGHHLAWWVSEPDRGQADAINKGFDRSTGEIVAWLNSDDIYLPGCIQAAVQVLQVDPGLVLVYGDMLSIDSAGETINVQKFDNWGLDGLMRFQIIGQPAVFMRRSTLEQVGFMDIHFHLMLDHHLWLKMAQCGKIMHVPQLWAAARYHEGAKNIARATEYGGEALEVVAWMKAQPGLQARYARNWRRIQAGAQLFNAHYLLDGGQYSRSLKAYLRSFFTYPPAVLPELHRVAFASASLLFNVDRLRDWYLHRRQSKLNHQSGRTKED